MRFSAEGDRSSVPAEELGGFAPFRGLGGLREPVDDRGERRPGLAPLPRVTAGAVAQQTGGGPQLQHGRPLPTRDLNSVVQLLLDLVGRGADGRKELSTKPAGLRLHVRT